MGKGSLHIEPTTKHQEQLRILSQSLSDLNNIETPEDVFKHIAKLLGSYFDNTIVLVLTINENKKITPNNKNSPFFFNNIIEYYKYSYIKFIYFLFLQKEQKGSYCLFLKIFTKRGQTPFSKNGRIPWD